MSKGKLLRTISMLRDVYKNGLPYERIFRVKGDKRLRLARSRAKRVKNSRKKLLAYLKNQSSLSRDDENHVTKNVQLHSAEDLKLKSEVQDQTEEYTYDEQCNMISFLIETNRISSCCSIHIWQLMKIERLKKPAESLLKQFTSVIAPKISQFLHQLNIIELPGILAEFRLAISKAGIHENASSASLSAASSSSSIIREPLHKIRNREIPFLSPVVVLSRESAESNGKYRANKMIESRKDGFTLVSSTRAENEGNKKSTDSHSNNQSLIPSVKEEAEENEIIPEKCYPDDSVCSGDDGSEHNKIDNNYKIFGKTIGRKIWEEMYGPITLGEIEEDERFTLNKDTAIIREKELKPKDFSLKLLEALGRERSQTKHRHLNAYCLEEQLAMLHYFICRPEEIKHFSSYKTFENIQRENWIILRNRTFMSMRSHFCDFMTPNLDKFGLPNEILNEFLFWQWYKQYGRDD